MHLLSWCRCTNGNEPQMNNNEILDYTEEVTVTLTRSDWNWFVTLMSDSVNKMEQAVSAAGMDAESFLSIDVLRTIRDEIAKQSGLEHHIK